MSDNFWDVRERERQEDQALTKALEACDLEIDLARRAKAISSAAGFADFVKSVQRLHELATRRLANDVSLTNDGLREQRGGVRALSDVLGLLMGKGTTDLLEVRRTQVQNAIEDAMQRRPKQREEPK